jgi:hypothetical protein
MAQEDVQAFRSVASGVLSALVAMASPFFSDPEKAEDLQVFGDAEDIGKRLLEVKKKKKKKMDR